MVTAEASYKRCPWQIKQQAQIAWAPVYMEEHIPFHLDEKLPCRAIQDSVDDLVYHLFAKYTKTLQNIIYDLAGLANW